MSQRLKTIQALRGIAAMAVVLSHYRLYLHQNEIYKNLWDGLLGWGIVGVDIFFVISGFIMAYTTVNHPASIESSKNFILNRIIRIVPNYYLFLFLSFLFGGAMSIFHYEDKTQDLISAVSFMVYIPNIAPYYMDINHGIYPVRWTLNYEFYFYIVFSICLLFKYRFAILFTWCLLAIAVIPVFYGNAPTLEASGYEVKTALYGFLSNPLIIEFLIGAAAGSLYIRVKDLNILNISFFISLALLFYIFYAISTGMQHGINVKISLPIGFLVLFSTLAENKIKIFIPKILLWLGDISFSLYLVHLPVGFALFDRVEKAAYAPAIGIPYALMAILLSLILAHFAHKYIEIQLSNWLKRKMLSA